MVLDWDLGGWDGFGVLEYLPEERKLVVLGVGDCLAFGRLFAGVTVGDCEGRFAQLHGLPGR